MALLLGSDTASIQEAKGNILACIFEFLIRDSHFSLLLFAFLETFSHCILGYTKSSFAFSLVLSKG